MSAIVHAGTSFVVSDRHGQISSGNHGVYFQDERFLSRLELLIGGKWPMALSVVKSSDHEATFIGTNPELPGAKRSTLQVTRRRRLAEEALTEEIEIHNYGDDTATLDLALTMAADFASIFQVKSKVQSGQGSIHRDVSELETQPGRAWRFTHQAGHQRLETELVFSRPADEGGAGTARFALSIPRHEKWSLRIEAHLRVNGAASTSRPKGRRAGGAASGPAWSGQEAPTLETDHLVRSLLGLFVDAPNRSYQLRPVPVEGLSYLRLRGVRVGGTPVDIDVRFTGVSPELSVTGLPSGWRRVDRVAAT